MFDRNSAQLKEQLKNLEAKYATSIKPHEQNTINYCIMNLSQDKFELVESAKYLWVLTWNEVTQEPEVFFGIENPLDYPQAFHVNIQGYLKKLKQNLDEAIDKIKQSDADHIKKENQINAMILQNGFPGRGHPTLAIKYNNNGDALPCKSYAGGELFFEKDQWVLNNASGRFYHIFDKLDFKQRKLMLELIAYQFSNHPCIQSDVKVRVYVKSCDNLWNKFTKRYMNEIAMVGIMIIMKAIKNNMRTCLAVKGNTTARVTELPEYIAIKQMLLDKKLADLQSLVDFALSQDEFFILIKNIVKDNQSLINFKELKNELTPYLDFLQSKISEVNLDVVDLSNQPGKENNINVSNH